MGIRRLGLLLVGPLLLAYVLSPERVLREIARIREGSPPVRLIVAVVSPEGETRAWVDLHPSGGWRVTDEQGRSWVGRGVWLRPPLIDRPPAGLPYAWLLWASDEELLPGLVAEMGVDMDRSELARCGDADCVVLGGRSGRGQIWVDKDRFEVRRIETQEGIGIYLEGYRKSFSRVRLPARIRVVEPGGWTAEVEIVSAEPAGALEDDPDLVPAAPQE
ncbi:MAG: hypothetical protein V3T14_08675 [Myxococcota bacterium]